MTTEVVEHLIDGTHCCICDTPGKHRRDALNVIVRSVRDAGFLVLCKDARDIPECPTRWAAYRDQLRTELSSSEIDRVVVFDNCDKAFSSAARGHVEQILSLVGFGASLDCYQCTRLVVALGPRDIGAIGLSPDVRERCAVFSSREILGAEGLVVNTVDDAEFVQALGSLRVGDRARCRSVVSSARSSQPKRLKTLDRFLFPLVYAEHGYALPNPHLSNVQVQMLCAELWPDGDIQMSARRFCSLVSFEEDVLWVDPYLSFEANVIPVKLVEFMREVFLLCPTLKSLKMLARVRNLAGVASLQARVSAALRSEPWSSRVAWKLFNKAGGDIHDRHLVMLNRQEAFTMPPADRILGMTPVGNEVDALLDYSATTSDRTTWSAAVQIFP